LSYDENHTSNDCDRCGKRVGINNLNQCPFRYMDHNDDMHADQGHGYRQYYICEACSKIIK